MDALFGKGEKAMVPGSPTFLFLMDIDNGGWIVAAYVLDFSNRTAAGLWNHWARRQSREAEVTSKLLMAVRRPLMTVESSPVQALKLDASKISRIPAEGRKSIWMTLVYTWPTRSNRKWVIAYDGSIKKEQMNLHLPVYDWFIGSVMDWLIPKAREILLERLASKRQDLESISGADIMSWLIDSVEEEWGCDHSMAKKDGW